jgi:hypothetical protein
MSYVFKFKRKFFWHKVTVIGHGYNEQQDKMVLYLPGGSIRELRKWRDCEVFLGTDWVLAQKKMMEEKAGTTIPLSV